VFPEPPFNPPPLALFPAPPPEPPLIPGLPYAAPAPPPAEVIVVIPEPDKTLLLPLLPSVLVPPAAIAAPPAPTVQV